MLDREIDRERERDRYLHSTYCVPWQKVKRDSEEIERERERDRERDRERQRKRGIERER